MKKIKVFLALIFSLACMFSLVACGGNNGYYVEDSFDADISYYTYDGGHASASVEFQVYIADKGKNEISYTLTMYYYGEKIESESFTSTCNSNGKETVDVSKYWSVDYYKSNASEYGFDVWLTNVKVTKSSSIDSAYVGLAIGFGVAGGLILAGIIVLYICLNKKGAKA
ncbi:MAG: hypothetical protein K2K13_04340 [Clostridiales bacterium]|nr:hypothetical protein [Clostridiales bacterium]